MVGIVRPDEIGIAFHRASIPQGREVRKEKNNDPFGIINRAYLIFC